MRHGSRRDIACKLSTAIAVLAWSCLMPPLALGEAAAPAPSPRASDEQEVIVVTASQTPQPFEDVTATVDVVGQETIVLRRDQEISDALRNLAGLHLDQPGGRGGRASLYMRGLDPNQTVIMIDGIRVNDPTNNRGGSFDLTTLDVEAVERIEVVRGPLSAIHGSDALAGAVNIITRGGRGPDSARLDLSGGRYGQYRTVASLKGQRGPIDLLVSGGWVDSGKPKSESEYKGAFTQVSLGAELPFDADARATVRYANGDAQAFPDDSGGEEFAARRALEKRDVEELTAGLKIEQSPLEWLDYSLVGSYYRRTEDRTSPGVAPGLRDPVFGIPAEQSEDRFERGAFTARASFDLGAGFSAALGGDVYHEKGEIQGDLFPMIFFLPPVLPTSFESERTVGGPFMELHFDSEFGLIVEAALRIDITDQDVDTQYTPRVGAAYMLPWLPIQLRGSWGEGFKLPSFYAVGNPIVGNRDLKPEKSRGYDIGVRGWFWEERVRATLTYFDIEVKDQIDFDAGPPPILVNRDKVVSRGCEFELLLTPIEQIDFGGQVTFTKTDIRASDQKLRNRPRWRGDLSFTWRPLDALSLNLVALFVGKVFDSSIPTGDRTLDSYTRLDFAGSWQVFEHSAVYFAVDNLLNENYQEAVGFPAPGISPRVGIDIRY